MFNPLSLKRANKFKNQNLHSSIDIIPIQSSSTEKRHFMDPQRFRGQERPGNYFQRDYQQILDRVQNYLYENEDKVFIDVNQMADTLQRKYREYYNRKRNQFRHIVRKAYDEITETVSKKSNVQWNEEEEEVDIESDPDEDILVQDMLYKKSQELLNGNSSDKELIDICSDDDNPKSCEPLPKRKRTDSFSVCNKSPRKTNQNDLEFIADDQVKNLLEPELEIFKPMEKVYKEQQKPQKEKEKQISRISKTKDFTIDIPTVKLKDFSVDTETFIDVCKILLHIKKPKLCLNFDESPPKGIMICGPPGCGKTHLANVIAGELELPLLSVLTINFFRGIQEQIEMRIKDVFNQAMTLGSCVIFFDEIDGILSPETANETEKKGRIISQILLCLDDLASKDTEFKILVLIATSKPEDLDVRFRASNRFDKVITLRIPDAKDRANILKKHTANLKLSEDVDLVKIASLTSGYVAADLITLIKEAKTAAINRASDALRQLFDKQNIPENSNPILQDNVNDANKPESTEIDATNINEDEVQITEPDNVDKPAESKTDKPNDSNGEKSNNEINKLNESIPSTTSGVSPMEITKEKDDDAVIIGQNIIEGEVEQEEKKMVAFLYSDKEFTDEQWETFHIEQTDFVNSINAVRPILKREGLMTLPNITLNDIGGLQNIKDELYRSLIVPLKTKEMFEELGLVSSNKILLCGPPGCGKTMLSKAIANEAEVNFFSVKGSELISLHTNERVKTLRQCFRYAKNSTPCIIFIDEIDVLCPSHVNGEISETSRVVNQILMEINDASCRQMFLIATSNRSDLIDPLILKCGRFDKILYVNLPDSSDRQDILKTLTKNGTKLKFSDDIKFNDISSDARCEGLTGADLAALIKEAGIQVLIEKMKKPEIDTEICSKHIDAALNNIKPSVQENDMKYYSTLRDLYSLKKIHQDEKLDKPLSNSVNASIVDTTVELMNI